MGSEQEIVRIGRQLEKIANSDTPNEALALDMLRALQGLPMTLDTLQKSRVGLSVNKLRKKCDGSEMATTAKKLIKSWKKLLTGHSPSGKDSKASTPKSPPLEHSPPLQRQPSHPPTPPPVIYSPPSTTVTPLALATADNGSSAGSIITSPQALPNGEFPPTPSSSSSTAASSSPPMQRLLSQSTIVLDFSSSIDGSRRVPQTGSDVRDRCRDLLVKALMKGFSDVSIEDEIKFYNLGARIEESIFAEFRDVGNKYKMRVRSRVSNLGDLKNPDLRQSVITGDVTPSRIAVMTTEEMASDSMKKIRKQFTKDAIRDAQMATSSGTQTTLLKCPKCRKRNCTYTQAQTRSADEPMTTFAYCQECGFRWKFC